MKSYWIGLDVHCSFCQFAWSTPGGKIREQRPVATTIPSLREAIAEVPQPRTLVFEEGPLADWLFRNLRDLVDQTQICDPRRNHLIAKDGDKDDPIDVAKLLQLAQGDFLRPVHHSESDERAAFKQHMALYHNRVRGWVAESLRLIWHMRRFGIMVNKRQLLDPQKRRCWLSQLPPVPLIHEDTRSLFHSFDTMADQIDQLRSRLVAAAGQIPMVRRFTALPGVAWVRAATFYAYIDTPFRFKSKAALWKYMGIGLQRRHSGNGPERLGVAQQCNRVLKDMILGAAKSAAVSSVNPFADQYRRYLDEGKPPQVARRNVARSLAMVMWGMWKSDREYQPHWVGVPAKDLMVGV